MTLDKHDLDGVPKIKVKTLPAGTFEQLLIDAGYTKTGTAPAQGNRVKVWWGHPVYRRIEAIYSPDLSMALSRDPCKKVQDNG